jgi:enamine deaminase RidA (YjgF/YER057c/UK114 family)
MKPNAPQDCQPLRSINNAQRMGNQLFVAGQVPHDGRLVGPDDPYAQALQ